MRVTIASVLSHLVIRPQLFYKINENKSKRKINIDLAIIASRIPRGAIHDRPTLWESYIMGLTNLNQALIYTPNLNLTNCDGV